MHAVRPRSLSDGRLSGHAHRDADGLPQNKHNRMWLRAGNVGRDERRWLIQPCGVQQRHDPGVLPPATGSCKTGEYIDFRDDLPEMMVSKTLRGKLIEREGAL